MDKTLVVVVGVWFLVVLTVELLILAFVVRVLWKFLQHIGAV